MKVQWGLQSSLVWNKFNYQIVGFGYSFNISQTTDWLMNNTELKYMLLTNQKSGLMSIKEWTKK